MVLDDYTEFVNNFDKAMETLNQAKKDNSALSRFLKVSCIQNIKGSV